MQHSSAANQSLIVPVHHDTLFRCVYVVVIDILACFYRLAAELTFQLRIFLREHIVVAQAHMEDVPAVLYVLYAGLPEEIQQVDFLYLDVAQAVVLLRIPEHTLAG